MVAAAYLSGKLLSRALEVRRIAICCVLAGISLASPPSVGRVAAGESRAYMTVTATVVNTVALRTVHQSQQLVISVQDAQRGYVDVPAGSRLELSYEGPYVLEFRPIGDIFRAVKVSGLSTAAEFAAEGGTMLQRSSGRGSNRITISYRFQLAPGIGAGAYRWPLVLTVLPV